jgi:hypothetical protein
MVMELTLALTGEGISSTKGIAAEGQLLRCDHVLVFHRLSILAALRFVDS